LDEASRAIHRDQDGVEDVGGCEPRSSVHQSVEIQLIHDICRSLDGNVQTAQ